MAKNKPEYEVNSEFNEMAMKLVEKFPEKFNHIPVDKICCVNITNKTRKEDDDTHDRIWKIQAVKMPMAIHCNYSFYIVLYSSDWEERSEKHKLALVADALHGIPDDAESEGKVNPCDTKGYGPMFRTLGLDFESNGSIPHLLNDDIVWR